MNHWLDYLNRHSTSWLTEQAWPMVWQSSLLIVLAAVASRTVLRKSPAQLRYGLWCVVLLRLLLPPTLDLPTSMAHWGAPVMQRHAPMLTQMERFQPDFSELMRQPLSRPVETRVAETPIAAPPAPRSSITLGAALLLLWGLVTTLLTLLLATRIARFHRIIRSATPASGPLMQEVNRLRAQMRIRRPVNALITENDLSPAVYGVFRPRILLPRTVIEGLSGEQLSAVIAHELAHVKRGDTWVNWLQLLLGIAYFFHPLVWYANRKMRMEREQACDDLTLVTLGLNRDGYAQSLVSVAERVSVAALFTPAQVGVVETKIHLAKRLRRILNERLRPVPRLTWFGAAIVVAFAALFGTWHSTQAAPGATETRSVEIKAADTAGKPLEGVVRNADGTPVAQANVYMAARGDSVTLAYGRIDSGDCSVTTTDATGRFSFPFRRDNYSLIIADDRGYANVSKDDFDRSRDITLQPWSRIEGVVMIGAKPGADQLVQLEYMQHLDSWAPRVAFRHEVSTGPDGRFAFERAIPGSFTLSRGIRIGENKTLWSFSTPIKMPADGQLSVTLGGMGRPVKGRLTAPGGYATTIQSGIRMFEIDPRHRVDPASISGAEKNVSNPNAKGEETGKAQLCSFQLLVQEEGSFSVDDVPAGDYLLSGIVCGSLKGDASGNMRPRCKANYEFTVPEMPSGRSDEALDLGVIPLEIVKQPKEGEAVSENEGVKPNGAIEMLPLDVKVVDESGAPVEGASVLPCGLRTKVERGSHYGWRDEVHGQSKTVKTDTKGIAQIQYPKYVDEHSATGEVTVAVSRSGCVSRQIDVKVDGSSPPIALEQGATVRVSGYVDKKENIAWPIYALMDIPQIFRSENGWIPAAGDEKRLENDTVNDGKHYLWLVYRSETQGLLFSQCEEVIAQKGKSLDMSLALEPGCRFEGKLDDSVPRPIKNGVAEIRVIPNGVFAEEVKGGVRVQWTAQAPIHEDGSFVFESLPMGHAEIAAYCDGAAVKYADKGTSPMLGQPFPTTTFGSVVTGIVVPMQPTATAAITVEGPDGRPLPGAKVSFWPNLYWFKSYTTVAGPAPMTTEQSLQLDPKTLEKKYAEAFTNVYSKVTDESGKAVIKNLPAYANGYTVQHEAFQMPIRQQGPAARRDAPIALKPGETTVMVAQMERKGVSFLGDTDAAKESEAPKSQLPSCAPPTEDKFAIPATPATPKNQLEGQVVDEDGKPLAGVNVNAWTWCPGNETQTDSEGRFVLPDFEKDQTEIEVRFSKDGYSPIYMFRQFVGKMSQPAVMNNQTYIEGTVTDSTGKPIANALVRADAGPRQAEGVYITDTATETRTKADGTYRHYVQNDTYTVTALTDAEMKVVTGVAVAKHEAKRLNVQLAPGPVFRAKIMDSLTQQPVAGVQLGSWRWKNIKGVSGADGMVAIAGIPGESFEFDVEGKDAGVTRWWSEQATREWDHNKVEEEKWQRNFDSLQFNVTSNMEPVTIVVERGVHIRGGVTDPDGKPVAGATVAPAKTGSGNSITGDTRFSVETGGDGNFDMLLPASKIREYNLIVHDGKYQEWRNWANGVMDPITTQPGDVLEGVKMQLRRPCEVRGQALDEQGEPVVDREVRACAFELNDNRYYVPTTRTDSEGHFDLKYVAPGKHYVQVAPFWLKPNEALEGTSQVVEVTHGKPAEGISLTAKPMR